MVRVLFYGSLGVYTIVHRCPFNSNVCVKSLLFIVSKQKKLVRVFAKETGRRRLSLSTSVNECNIASACDILQNHDFMVPNFLMFLTTANNAQELAYARIFVAGTCSQAHFGRHLGIQHANVPTVALNDIEGIGKSYRGRFGEAEAVAD